MPFDINARIEAWRSLLLDTSKRNRLINFKVGGTGGVALIHPDPGDIWHRLVASESRLIFPWKGDLVDLLPQHTEAAWSDTPLFRSNEPAEPDLLERCRRSPRFRPDRHLLTDMPDDRLATRLTRLALNSRESLTEQGVATLYVAFGFLRWFDSPDSQVEIRSPLLLVPVCLERENVAAPWQLRAEDEDVLTNHSLAQLLANDFKLCLPPLEEEAEDDAGWRVRYYGEVERCIRDQRRWEVLDEVALGTFNFQKLAMWGDLDRNRDRLAAHDLCRAVAGDPTVALRPPADLPAAADLDREAHPGTVFHILDADSSQHEAIAAATRGASLVLDGPPGTGKSQTIANVIAEFLAANKTVLFVSEKAAALEVVQRRLQSRGLGDFCLACHSHKANKRDVLAELGRCLAIGSESSPDPTDDLQRLHEARQQLNNYVRELHVLRPPLGMKAYHAHGELARLARLSGASRCPVDNVLGRAAAYLRRVEELLDRLPDCRPVLADPDRHPWRGCQAPVYTPSLREDVRHHFGRLAACLDRLAEPVASLHRLGFCKEQPNLAQWHQVVGRAPALLSYPPVPAGWFHGDPRPAAEDAVRLDDLSQACRRARAALPEFSAEALRGANPGALAALPAFPAEPRLLLRSGETLNSVRQRLAALGGSLTELRRVAVAVAAATDKISELLRAQLPAQPVRALSRLAEWSAQIAQIGPIRPTWWESGRRKELITTLARCQEESRAAQQMRAELAARLSPRALAPESAALATRAASFRSFLFRLLPRWRSLKCQVAGWYIGEAPKTAALLDDLGKLAAYHRRTDYCRQVREQYATDLLPGADGEPDWDRTLEALRSVERLGQKKVPPALQATLSAEDGVDRAALSAAARSLEDQTLALRERIEALAQECDLTALTDGTPGHFRITAPDLVTWLEAQVCATGRLATLLDLVAQLVADGKDMPAEVLPARLLALAKLGHLREQVAGLGPRLWAGEAPPTGVEEQDWSALRRAAEGLLRLLDLYRGQLPAPVVRVLTCQDARDQLAEAVRQSNAAEAAGFAESWGFLAGLFDLTSPVSIGVTIESAPLADLSRWLAERAEDAHRLQEWTRFCEVEREAAREGVATVLAEVRAGKVKPEEAAPAFRARFLGLWLDAVHERAPALRRFTTDDHERLIGRFRELDCRAVASAAARIRALQLTRPDRPRSTVGEAPGSSELGTLLREVGKKRRHLPLRRLFTAIPNLLLRLKPCIMMSPLAVSTYLDSRDIHFDLVIFDEASQVRPHDAISAIFRGRQLLVAGDQKQLPPTSFFDRALADEGLAEDEEGGLEDYESILDVCCTLGLPRRRLRWHYRSRREGLIAFSNQFIYGNELITFPSVHDVAGNPSVRFEYVQDGRWKPGASGGFNSIEARRTAELVLEHFRQHPDQSLGVIAFSQRQQMRILEELELLRRANPDLEAFFHEDRDEPFFVKNLENVQGDERAVIFLGIGYGPDDTGRVAMRFGPLNQQGGERRLNVAVTRARQGMTVISSLRAQDLDLSKTSAQGVQLLHAFLDYAQRGPEALRAAITSVAERGFESPFEQEVCEELTRGGLTVHPQVGCSGFRIDLGVVDPGAPGRYLLGVECDGATYHSSATARDRDRLRQEVLEDLGWRICRVWSTDWVRDCAGQVRRVRAALEQARSEAEAPPAPALPVGSGAADGQEPQAVVAPMQAAAPALPSYGSINEVPDRMLRELLCDSLQTFGATEAGELIRAVARRLGFRKTGSRIQTRIEACIEELIRKGLVCRAADQRLQLAPPVVTA
jgi:very-short-patch-repair endonuclease